jgi:hypothetical protein
MNPTPLSELSRWQLESQWTIEFSKGDYRSLDSKVHNIIGKFLKLKCLKWAHMTHLGT